MYPNSCIPVFEYVCNRFADKDELSFNAINSYIYSFFGSDDYRKHYQEYIKLLQSSGYILGKYDYADKFTILGSSISTIGAKKSAGSVSIRRTAADLSIEEDNQRIDIVVTTRKTD